MWLIAAETDGNPLLRESMCVTIRVFCICEEPFLPLCWNTEGAGPTSLDHSPV